MKSLVKKAFREPFRDEEAECVHLALLDEKEIGSPVYDIWAITGPANAASPVVPEVRPMRHSCCVMVMVHS